jgi:hypothetical protein
MRRPQLARHPTRHVGLQRVGAHLRLVDVTAPRAAERPVLKAHAGLGNALYLHLRLTYRAAAIRGSAQRECRFWKLGHDAPLLTGGSATLSVTESQRHVGDAKTVRFVRRSRKRLVGLTKKTNLRREFYFSCSMVTATAPMAERRTLFPSTSATRLRSTKW